MDYSIRTIADIVQPLSTRIKNDCRIQHVSIDTRSITFPTKTLFIAFKGQITDGHNFIEKAHQDGVRNFLVSDALSKWSHLDDCNILMVKDPLDALQRIAVYHRENFIKCPVIGITGSHGKTWVKEWLFQLLHPYFHIIRSPGSYNSQIGVALSILLADESNTLCIFEAGISKPAEMEHLEAMIKPTIGIFTGIGNAHEEGFDNPVQKCIEKLLLFKSCSIVFHSAKDGDLKELAPYPADDIKWRTWSVNTEDGDYNIEIDGLPRNAKEITFEFQSRNLTIDMPVMGDTAVANIIPCVLTMRHLGFKHAAIKEAVKGIEPVEMRLELLDAIQQCQLIVDVYSFHLYSILDGILKMRDIGKGLRKTIILSDIPNGQQKDYEFIASFLDPKSLNRLITIGRDAEVYNDLISKKIQHLHFPATLTFLKEDLEKLFNRDVILIKGARKFKFERIVRRLLHKRHSVTLHFDFEAMLNNIRRYSRAIRPDTKMMAVIKASAYGAGSIRIARFLEFYHIDYLAVAVIDEGVELRKAGIQMPILVLNPDFEELDQISKYDLEFEIYSLSFLNKVVEQTGETDQHFQIHLKCNSGMNRLGLDESNLVAVNQLLKDHQNLHVQSVFTHMAASEDAEEDSFSKTQNDNFLRMYNKVTQGLDHEPLRHVLNSSGILRFPDMQYEMVRLGIGLYGVGVDDDELIPVHKLSAVILQIRKLKRGDSVSYGRHFTAEKEMTVATINIGYADGLPRNAGNNRYSVLIKDKEAPIIGNVCMDMIVVDVSHIDDVHEGDTVWIFNEKKSIEELAKACDTIPYEILSRIGPRVKRLFHHDI